jgi:hypothetical protein
MATMTIEQYLQVLPNFTFPDTFIQKAMGLNGISAGESAFQVTDGWEKKRDLAEAMMWDYACGLVSSISGGKKQIGNRAITYAAIQATSMDRANWTARANALRKKWGVTVTPSDAGKIRDASFLWGATYEE